MLWGAMRLSGKGWNTINRSHYFFIDLDRHFNRLLFVQHVSAIQIELDIHCFQRSNRLDPITHASCKDPCKLIQRELHRHHAGPQMWAIPLVAFHTTIGKTDQLVAWQKELAQFTMKLLQVRVLHFSLYHRILQFQLMLQFALLTRQIHGIHSKI